jgi:hypothetical protein
MLGLQKPNGRRLWRLIGSSFDRFIGGDICVEDKTYVEQRGPAERLACWAIECLFLLHTRRVHLGEWEVLENPVRHRCEPSYNLHISSDC